jgi:hypothetical protein
MRVIKWLETKNVLGAHKNTETGWDNIVINKRSVKSVIRHGGRDGKVALLKIAPQLIEYGIYLETNLINENGLASHLFMAKAIIDGEFFAICYVVREDNNSRRYYDHCLLKIKALGQINDQAPASTDERQSPVTVTHSRPEKVPSVKLPLNNILKKHLAVNTLSK